VKVHNHKPFSMNSLANLSKGEFLVEDITQMESVLLKALDWNMNPPTAASFCGYFIALLPPHVTSVTRQAIYHQSCFFYELSVMDYSFMVTANQSEVAFAGILNSLAGLSLSLLSVQDKKDFIKDIEGYTGMSHVSVKINKFQKILMSLYQSSSENKVINLKNTVGMQHSRHSNNIINQSDTSLLTKAFNFSTNHSTTQNFPNE
jgi:hypothetical protein